MGQSWGDCLSLITGWRGDTSVLFRHGFLAGFGFYMQKVEDCFHKHSYYLD